MKLFLLDFVSVILVDLRLQREYFHRLPRLIQHRVFQEFVHFIHIFSRSLWRLFIWFNLLLNCFNLNLAFLYLFVYFFECPLWRLHLQTIERGLVVGVIKLVPLQRVVYLVKYFIFLVKSLLVHWFLRSFLHLWHWWLWHEWVRYLIITILFPLFRLLRGRSLFDFLKFLVFKCLVAISCQTHRWCYRLIHEIFSRFNFILQFFKECLNICLLHLNN